MNESFDFPATELRSVKPGRGSSNKSAVKNGVASLSCSGAGLHGRRPRNRKPCLCFLLAVTSKRFPIAKAPPFRKSETHRACFRRQRFENPVRGPELKSQQLRLHR